MLLRLFGLDKLSQTANDVRKCLSFVGFPASHLPTKSHIRMGCEAMFNADEIASVNIELLAWAFLINSSRSLHAMQGIADISSAPLINFCFRMDEKINERIAEISKVDLCFIEKWRKVLYAINQ